MMVHFFKNALSFAFLHHNKVLSKKYPLFIQGILLRFPHKVGLCRRKLPREPAILQVALQRLVSWGIHPKVYYPWNIRQTVNDFIRSGFETMNDS